MKKKKAIKLSKGNLERYKLLYLKQEESFGKVKDSFKSKFMNAKSVKTLRKIIWSRMGENISSNKNSKIIYTPMGGQNKRY